MTKQRSPADRAVWCEHGNVMSLDRSNCGRRVPPSQRRSAAHHRRIRDRRRAISEPLLYSCLDVLAGRGESGTRALQRLQYEYSDTLKLDAAYILARLYVEWSELR